MGRPSRGLLLVLALVLSVLAVTAVHGILDATFVVKLVADALVGLCWLLAAPFLLLRLAPDAEGGSDAAVPDAGAPLQHTAVRFRVDEDSRARSHWRYGP
ncbi:hypothetical protein [Streptomyces sp. NPDC048527]|uniref:hypothetical protein n=1 Tax=Streptomyces sp. NPDC048527 TaxID=3365568 RepID=UPI00371D5347